MGERSRLDPRKQFSKWLAKVGAIYWIVYLSCLLALIYARPEVALPCVYLTIIVTVNKMLDTWAYTKNSTYEKGLLAILDKTKMELSLKGAAGDAKAESTGENAEEGGEEEDG